MEENGGEVGNSTVRIKPWENNLSERQECDRDQRMGIITSRVLESWHVRKYKHLGKLNEHEYMY